MIRFPIPDVALAQHIAVLGKTGSGKTSTEKLIVEHVAGEDFRVCVLDTIKSDWWGITSSADGKKPGLPFQILGGPHGHVPLHSSAGKVIGQLVGEGKLPLSIVDMADFEMGGPQKFFIDFAQSLLRHIRGVVYLVIEEAHELAPKERAGFQQENMAMHFAKKLATAGRSKGIRLIVATQRIQALHNAVLGSCETMIAHRLTTPADQEPVIKWLKANADKATLETVASSLASLPTGTAWVCSGEAQVFEKIAFPKFKTYDNTATPTGDASEHQVTTAAVDLDRLRAVIGDAVKEAEANDPRKLKAEIARLTAELKKAASLSSSSNVNVKSDEAAIRKAVGSAKAEIEAQLKAAISAAIAGQEEIWREGVRSAVDSATARLASEIAKAMERGTQNLKRNIQALKIGGAITIPEIPKAAVVQRSESRASNARMTGSIPAGRSNGSGQLDGPLQRIIDAIRWWNVFGISEPTHQQVAFIANYVAGSGTWTRYLSALRSQGLISPKGPLILTPEGQAHANDPDDAPSAEVLRESVVRKIDAPLARILSPLLEAYPNSLSHEDAAAAANYEPGSGTWSRYLSSLRSLDLIEKRGPLKAQDWLFP